MNSQKFLKVVFLSAAVLGSPNLVTAKDAGREPSIGQVGSAGTMDVQREIVQAEANQAVAAFAESKPQGVVERVRLTMADEIEAGRAKSLEDAYILAIDQHFKVTVDNYSKLGLGQDEWFWLLVEREKRQLPSTPK